MKNTMLPLVKPAPTAIFLIALVASGSSWSEIKNPSEPFISYTVKQGETVQMLANNLLADPRKWNQLAALNGLKDPNVIDSGFVLDVPRSLIFFGNQPKLVTNGILTSATGAVTINGAPARAGSVVSEGARVQTAAGSSAVVKLSDGSSVQLMPRTLAEVALQHGYAMKDPASSISTTWFSGAIRLVEGALDIAADKLANRKEPLNVITPTALVGVRGTRFRVAYDDPAVKTARTEVLEGKVRADNPEQGAGADVGGGFGAAVKPNEREIKVVPLLPAIAESQLPERVERARGGQQAAWAVGSLQGAAAYQVELAQDAAFTQIVFDTKSTSNEINLAAAPNGGYFARVRGVDASGIEGYNAVRRIDIADANVPALLIWHEKWFGKPQQ